MRIKKTVHIPLRMPLPNQNPQERPQLGVQGHFRSISVNELIDSLQRLEPIAPPDAQIEFVPTLTDVTSIYSSPQLSVSWEEELLDATT